MITLVALWLAAQAPAAAPAMTWCTQVGQQHCFVGATPPPPPPPADRAAIASLLAASAAAWSADDLDGFLAPYDFNALAVFRKPSGETFWANARGGYRGFPSRPRKLGLLSYENPFLQVTGADVMTAFFRYRLQRPGASTEEIGVATLVLHSTPDGWRIMSENRTADR